MFFSPQQIASSISQLSELNPFFGTSFLAFKKAGLPIGETETINFSQIVENILQTYYRPEQNFSGFYTPFKTSDKRHRWNKERYGSTTLQRITSDTFSDALIHVKGSRDWGWRTDYVKVLKEKHLLNTSIPAFDLAVWLFRLRQWDNDIETVDVVEAFFREFDITDTERQLFDVLSHTLSANWLHSQPITTKSLLGIIGFPTDNSIVEEGATLKFLKLTGIGPAEKIECEFAPRLNLITGDNGLGKTFLLECAWWVLTGTWAGHKAYPRQDVAKNIPSIAFRIGQENQSDKTQTVKYDWDRLNWNALTKHNILPGLSIFSQADGSFAVWDPAKQVDKKVQTKGNLEALVRFSRDQVWGGVKGNEDDRGETWLCNGLIRDWVEWQTSDTSKFNEFKAVLKKLSPDTIGEALEPGQPIKMPRDSRKMPTLKFSYGEVPIILCSAGIQRIVALAYLLIWAWYEHVETSKSMRKNPQRSIIFLIDEMEAHLHPFWQRAIVPALTNVVQELAPDLQVQIIIATHSPLVLASVEPQFDEERDKIFHLYLEEGTVQFEEVPFIRRGRADLWLMSDLFGLKQPRSQVAEETIERAKQLQQMKNPPQEDIREVYNDLINILAPDDEFWPRWTYFAEREGVEI